MFEKFKYIAFLDIDGVLNHCNHHEMFEFIKESVDVLNLLYEKYNIEIVLSSSWKHAFTFKFMQNLFTDNGINAPLIDGTYVVINPYSRIDYIDIDELENEDTYNYLCSRDDEIYQWVKMYKPEHFVILDDFTIKHPELKDHHLLTRFWANSEKDMALRLSHLPEIESILEKVQK